MKAAIFSLSVGRAGKTFLWRVYTFLPSTSESNTGVYNLKKQLPLFIRSFFPLVWTGNCQGLSEEMSR